MIINDYFILPPVLGALGLLIASRVTSEELAGGLLNMLTWPMMLLSGVWFSMEGAHPILQKIADISPLTHMLKAARGIMIDGHTLLDVSYHLGVMAVMGLGTLAVLLWQFLRDKRKQQQAARRDTSVQFVADSQPQPLPSTMIELAELPAKDAV